VLFTTDELASYLGEDVARSTGPLLITDLTVGLIYGVIPQAIADASIEAEAIGLEVAARAIPQRGRLRPGADRRLHLPAPAGHAGSRRLPDRGRAGAAAVDRVGQGAQAGPVGAAVVLVGAATVSAQRPRSATGRPDRRAQMTSTCTTSTWGPGHRPDHGRGDPPELNPHTTKCRVRPATMRDFHSQAGGEELFASNYVVAIPFEQTPAARGEAALRHRVLPGPGDGRGGAADPAGGLRRPRHGPPDALLQGQLGGPWWRPPWPPRPRLREGRGDRPAEGRRRGGEGRAERQDEAPAQRAAVLRHARRASTRTRSPTTRATRGGPRRDRPGEARGQGNLGPILEYGSGTTRRTATSAGPGRRGAPVPRGGREAGPAVDLTGRCQPLSPRTARRCWRCRPTAPSERHRPVRGDLAGRPGADREHAEGRPG
jgi:hypothetical protein